MAKFSFGTVKDIAKNTASKVDVDSLKEKAVKATDTISEKASGIKETATEVKEDIDSKRFELDHMLEQVVNEYNDAYTLMNDKGLNLFIERKRSADSLAFVEKLVNSLANKPKSLVEEFEEINKERKEFVEAYEFADRELQAARVAAGSAGAGVAAGASVAFMAPTAAMWIATTFGTASTGTAISALSGAAATNAALAWLGGGALAAGGGGMAAGNALLALAGPVGWSIAGASLLSSIVIFSKKKAKLNKQKNEEIESVKNNIKKVKEMDLEIGEILNKTIDYRELLNKAYDNCLGLFNQDYAALNVEEKKMLGEMVTYAKIVAKTFGEKLTDEQEAEVEE